MGMENGKPSFVTAGPDVVRSFRSLQRRGSSINRDLPVIDCDLHNRTPSLEMLYPYLPDYWRDHCEESGFFGPDANDYPEGAPTSTRPEITEPSADRPQSDLALLREHALDPWGVQYGILTCAYRVQSVHNEDLAAALASAVNDWQIEHWLDPEPRLRGSLIVPSQNPELAAREIERLGNHPGFVQVMLPVRSQAPYGNRRYHPIYAAAARHDLVVGIHYGGAPGLPPTSVGWPSTYLEEYVGMSQVFQAQVLSLVSEGVFDQFPSLRVALIEAGFTWMPSLMWRFDKEWRGLRRLTPWVKRLPSAYIREHMRMTLQPIDEPPTAEQLLQIIGQLDSDDFLMFSTDYPHWHFDSPEEAFPAKLPTSLARKILSENAREFYRL